MPTRLDSSLPTKEKQFDSCKGFVDASAKNAALHGGKWPASARFASMPARLDSILRGIGTELAQVHAPASFFVLLRSATRCRERPQRADRLGAQTGLVPSKTREAEESIPSHAIEIYMIPPCTAASVRPVRGLPQRPPGWTRPAQTGKAL